MIDEVGGAIAFPQDQENASDYRDSEKVLEQRISVKPRGRLPTDRPIPTAGSEPLIMDGNKIGNFRPGDLNKSASTTNADGANTSNSPTQSMETRLLQKEKKRSVIHNDPALEPAKGGCCSGQPCQIF